MLLCSAAFAQTPPPPPLVTTKELFWGKTEALLGQQVILEGKLNFQTVQTPADCGLDKDSCACFRSMGAIFLDSIRVDGGCGGDRCSMMCSPVNPRMSNPVRLAGVLKMQSMGGSTPRLILESLDMLAAKQQIGDQWVPMQSGQFKVFLNQANAPAETPPVKPATPPAAAPVASGVILPVLTVKDLIWGRAEALNNQRIQLEGQRLSMVAEPADPSCYRQYCGCSAVQGQLFLDAVQLAGTCTGDNCSLACTPVDPTLPNPIRMVGTLKIIPPEADTLTDEPPTLSLTEIDPKSVQQLVDGQWVAVKAPTGKIKHQILPTKAEWTKRNAAPAAQ